MTNRTLIRAVTAVGVLLLATACSGSADVHGSLTLHEAFSPGSSMGRGTYPCVGTGGLNDIRDGASVTVYDDTGRIVATGVLDEGVALDSAGACRFPFVVADVPAADFYQVEVSHRGKVTFTSEDIADDAVELTLGP